MLPLGPCWLTRQKRRVRSWPHDLPIYLTDICTGIAAAEYIKTGHGHVNYNAIPSVVYTHPEVAWVGKTEQELKAANVQYNIGKFMFSANSRAKTNMDSEGFVKIIAEKETDKVLGVHIIGMPFNISFHHKGYLIHGFQDLMLVR